MRAKELLQAGRLEEAMAELERNVRASPADVTLRIFLFQLLAVLGDWRRSLTQLNVAAELEPQHTLMACICRAPLNCEALRAEVFAGRRTPLIFGEPEPWVGDLVLACRLVADEDYLAAQRLREQALAAAPAVRGRLDGKSFSGLGDADSRLGPVLEAIVESKYYWVPFSALQRVRIETPPTDLRDLVWIPATFTWINGGEAGGFIPTRYPGSELDRDDAVKLARKTMWSEKPGGTFLGLGQRTFMTDQDDIPLLEMRDLQLHRSAEDSGESEQSNA